MSQVLENLTDERVRQKNLSDERGRGSAHPGGRGQPAKARQGLSRVPIVLELPQDMPGLLGHVLR